MMRALVVLTILLMASAVVQADKVVRDQYGNLVETWRKRGNSLELGDWRWGKGVGGRNGFPFSRE